MGLSQEPRPIRTTSADRMEASAGKSGGYQWLEISQPFGRPAENQHCDALVNQKPL